MTYEQAVDILARRHAATELLQRAGTLPERRLPTKGLRDVRFRVQQWVAEFNPTRDEFEQAYDIVAHGIEESP